MIRLFLNVCKTFQTVRHLSLDDYEIYLLLSAQTEASFSCPVCKAPVRQFVKNGSYRRHFVFLEEGQVQDRLVVVKEVLCRSCHKTHALLSSLLIPYSSYGIRFLISLLYDRLSGRFPSIRKLCEFYDISERTFYRLRKRLLMDAHVLNLLLETYTGLLTSLRLLATADATFVHGILKSFFDICGYSFLQPVITFRQNVKTGNTAPDTIR